MQQSAFRPKRLNKDGRRVYTGGFDGGTGFSILYVAPEDEPENVSYAVIPSWVSIGNMAEIAKRSGLINPDVVDLLDEDEIVIDYDGVERFVGILGREAGDHRTNARNDPRRYVNEHATSLLLALAAKLIPEDRFLLKYVTALPVSLYEDELRRQVQDTFTTTYQYRWNGQAKNGQFICGAVVPEGVGGLLLYGDTSSLTLVLDFGWRTTECLTARGQKVDFGRSGGFALGVGDIIDAFNEELYKLTKRRMEVDAVDALLRAYVHGDILPVVKANRQAVSETKIREILDKVYIQKGEESNAHIASIIHRDQQGVIGGDYDLVLPLGGGGVHFRNQLVKLIPNVDIIDEGQNANAEGQHEIARGFSEAVWDRVVAEVTKRQGTGSYV